MPSRRAAPFVLPRDPTALHTGAADADTKAAGTLPGFEEKISTSQVNLAPTALADLLALSRSDEAPLVRAVINAVSPAETGFALGLLADRVPHRTLVAALNLREILRELPTSPFQMRVDFATLAKIFGLERRGLSWVRRVVEEEPVVEIEVLGQGNLVYDIGVRRGDKESLVKPGPIKGDLVRPDALVLFLEDPRLLHAVVELMSDMGLVHNPRFHLSVDDWQMEHASESFGCITDLF